MDHPLTVVGCFAHPDDETWVMSGSLALLVPDEMSLVHAFTAGATSG